MGEINENPELREKISSFEIENWDESRSAVVEVRQNENGEFTAKTKLAGKEDTMEVTVHSKDAREAVQELLRKIDTTPDEEDQGWLIKIEMEKPPQS